MRFNPLTVGFLTSTLLPGSLASPAAASTSLEDQQGGWIFSSPGYLVPVDTPQDKFDVNAPWMRPVLEIVNNDANETIFDVDGFDVVPQTAAAALEARGEVSAQSSTRFWLGRKRVDMGCGETITSIRGALGDAVYSLCKSGMCDNGKGVKYVRKISWMPNGFARRSRWIEITANGVYNGDHTLGNIHNAVKASVRSETVKWAWRKHSWKVGAETYYDKCKMAKFPNYIRIHKAAPDEGDVGIDVQFWINLNDSDSGCLTSEALAVVGGAIHGVVGAAFGAINMLCKTQY